MSLGTALLSAASGLRATQSQIETVSGNVANSGTPGYTKRLVNLQETVGNGQVNGVRVIGIERKLDAILQRELRTETSGSGYTGVRSELTTQLAKLFGQPGTDSSLSATLNAFTSSLNTLNTDPGSSTSRSTVISAAQSLASALNSISDSIQQMRTDVESKIGTDVSRVNELLKGIADVDVKVADSGISQPALLDQRDAMVNELSKYIDLRVVTNTNGTVALQTTGGLRLYDSGVASTLTFDGRGVLTPQSLYSTGASRGVGTITLTVPGGTSTDVIAQNVLRSGEIFGLVEMRDKTLVDAQGQIDEFAANLATALSDRQPVSAGFPAGSATPTGLSIDASGLQRGNVVTVSATVGGTPKTWSFVMTNGNALPTSATPNPNDIEVAYDIRSGPAGLATLIQSTIGGTVSASMVTSGQTSTLNVFTSGADTVTALGGRISTTALKNNVPPSGELPLFVDGSSGSPITNYQDGVSQKVGLSARIALNPQIASNPLALVDYQTGTLAGDRTRPKLLLDRLISTPATFSPQAGLGTATAPWSGTVADYASQVVAQQAGNASSAQRLDDGQKVVQQSIESRFAAASGVSVDEELSNLIQLQNAYAANARIVSAVKEMMDLLMRI